MTSTSDEPRTIAEIYGAATNSSHLEVTPDERTAIDWIVAAGWVQDGLGTALFRVMTEFDTVRANFNLTQQVFHQAMKVAANMNADARALQKAGDQHAFAMTLKTASELRTAAETTLISGRLMAQSAMKSERATKEAVIAFAEKAAARTGFQAEPGVVKAIAIKAFDYWLNAMCHACDGRGFDGGFGVPMVICKECHGGGRTLLERNGTYRLGANAREHQFGKLLLAEMDRKTDYVSAQMKRYMSGREPALPAPNPELTAAAHDLRKRLAELRSAAAQED